MKKRIITGIIFTIFVAACILPGYIWPLLPTAFFTILGVLAILEISIVIKRRLPDFSISLAIFGCLGVFLPVIPVIVKGDQNWKLIRSIIPSSPNKLLIERNIILDYILFLASLLVAFVVVYFFSVSMMQWASDSRRL